MTRRTQRTLALLVLGAVVLVAQRSSAGPEKIAFPASYKDGVRYATVDRYDVKQYRELYGTADAVKAAREGKPIPSGSHFVLADYRDGNIYRYFVMQRGEGWGDDYHARRRTGSWQFQWFWPDKTINAAENTERCQSCHRSREGSDFLFTGYRIPRFSGQPIE